VMYKWCQPSRLQYGSRAPDLEGTGRVRELFFQFGIFARETLDWFHLVCYTYDKMTGANSCNQRLTSIASWSSMA